MQLTQFTDYSLRTLIFLALRQGERSTISAIADSYQISNNHLMKVANRLTSLGYVEGVRGKNGGLRLCRAPTTIGIGEVIRDMEPDMAMVECFHSKSDCCLHHACTLAGILREATSAFLAVLDRYTLADLITNDQQLARLLGMRIPALSLTDQP